MDTCTYEEFKKLHLDEYEVVNVIAISTGENLENITYEVYYNEEYTLLLDDDNKDMSHLSLLFNRFARMPTNINTCFSFYSYCRGNGEDIVKKKPYIEIKGIRGDQGLFWVDIYYESMSFYEKRKQDLQVSNDKSNFSSMKETIIRNWGLMPNQYTREELQQNEDNIQNDMYFLAIQIEDEEEPIYELYSPKEHLSELIKNLLELGDQSELSYMLRRLCDLNIKKKATISLYDEYKYLDKIELVEVTGTYYGDGHFNVKYFNLDYI